MQRALWGRGFKAALGRADAAGEAGGLLMTAPPLALPPSLASAEEVAFEELGVRSLCIAPACELAARALSSPEERPASGSLTAAAVACRAGLVVDVGFSATTAAAVADGRLLAATVRRVDLGGKALTSLLREAISFRAVSLAGENHLAGAVKERVAFVAADPLRAAADCAAAGKGGGVSSTAPPPGAAPPPDPSAPPLPIDPCPAPGTDPRVEYVLPDGVTVRGAGFARPLPPRLSRAERQAAAAVAAAAGAAAGKKRPASAAANPAGPAENVIRLGVERFLVPETLFHPGDAGSGQGGVAEAAAAALAAAPAHLRPLLASRVLLVGGGSACPGLAARFQAELAPLLPDDCPLTLVAPPHPGLVAWAGGAALAADPAAWAARSLTKAEYEERGSAAAAWCAGGVVKRQ